MDNERAALVEARRRATEAAEADLPTFVRRAERLDAKVSPGLYLDEGGSYVFERQLGPREPWLFVGVEVALIAALAFCAGVLTHAVAWAVLR